MTDFAPVELAARGKPSLIRFIVLLLIVPACLAVFAIWLGSEYRRAEVTREEVRASYHHRLQLAELLSALKDAETAQRGYIITGEPSFLGPFQPAIGQARRIFFELGSGYARQTEQEERLTVLRGLVEAKINEMKGVALLRDNSGIDAAIERVKTAEGKMLMDEARRVVAQMIIAEDATLNHGRAQSLERTRLIQKRIWSLIILVAISLLIWSIVLWQAKRARYEMERRVGDSAARVRTIFASTIDTILIINPSGTIEMINAAGQTMLGYGPNELERRDISVLFDIAPGHGSFHDRIGLVDGKLLRPILSDRVARHKDGHEIPVDIALGVMPLPDGVHLVAAIRDITERKTIERMKDEFISTVSHELRTPLTSVVGSLGLLRAGSAGALPDQAQRLVEIAESNSRRLIRLINDILDIEKMGSGQMRFEDAPLDLFDVIRRSIESSGGVAQAKHVQLIVADEVEPTIVRGDADRLVQVLTNLLNNAVRFTPTERKIRVTLERRGGKAVVAVDDEGPGVPEEFRDRIFARFSQADGTLSSAGGSGLGLAISREIIRSHGGTIWFENRPGGGARFAFSLDLWEQRTVETDKDSPRLLICEDDVDVADTLCALLSAQGLACDRVSSAQEARAAALAGDYAAMLLDLHLPDGSGLDLLRTLRASPELRDLPVIVVSGASRDVQEITAPLDVIDWIEKPVDHRRLADAVGIAMQRAGVAQPTLLHVDDDLDMLEVTAAALAGRGRVVQATNLASARVILERASPDVVILDLGLPDGSGLDLLPELVDNDGLAIPTIIYTAQDVTADVEQRVDAVLIKSRKSLPNLEGTIRRILANRVPRGDVS